MRTPVASKMAFAMAAAVGRVEGSPAPLGGINLPSGPLPSRVDQKGVDLRNVPDVDGRIAQPVDRGHALGVKSHSLVKCPAHGLHQVRLDDVEDVLLVHHQPAILPAGELRHTYLASFAVDGDLGDGGDVRASARLVGEPAPAHDLGAGVVAGIGQGRDAQPDCSRTCWMMLISRPAAAGSR